MTGAGNTPLVLESRPYGTNYKYLLPIWTYPYTVSEFHNWVEYFYEFLRGSRLATTSELDVCEDPVSSLIESLNLSGEYIGLAV